MFRIWKTIAIVAISALLTGITIAANTDSDLRNFVVSLNSADGMKLSEAQMRAIKSQAPTLPERLHKVALQEEFRSPQTWFVSVNAPDQNSLDSYLSALAIKPTSVYESLFINSPEVGGGPKAGELPNDGHNVYMIQREIPGIGLAPMDKKVAVSRGSQKIIESLDGKVEWDHSFLTSEGTFCVYRAGDSSMIEEHARIAGIPANPITEVEHIIRNFSFD